MDHQAVMDEDAIIFQGVKNVISYAFIVQAIDLPTWAI